MKLNTIEVASLFLGFLSGVTVDFFFWDVTLHHWDMNS
jgi:hypothetical protein